LIIYPQDYYYYYYYCK